MFASPRVLLPIIIVVSMALAAISAYDRLPWADEGWVASPSLNLAKHGFAGTTIFESTSSSANGKPLLRVNERTYWVFPGQVVAQALWYLFVAPTMFLTRLLHILFIPAALLAFYILLLWITGEIVVAVLATGLLGTDFIFYSGAGFARPDMMCVTFGLLGLAAYLVLRGRSLAWAVFVSQLMIALSIISHPNGVLHLVALLILALYYDRKKVAHVRLVAVAAAAYVIVMTPWLIYIAKDVEAFRVQLTQNIMGQERVGLSANPVQVVWRELRERYVVAMGLTSPRAAARLKAVSLASFGVAVVLACIRRTWKRVPSMKLLLGLLAAYFAVQCVYNLKMGFYLIHILPFYCAVFACFIVDEFRRRRVPRAVLGAWVAAIVATQFALAAGTASRSYRPNEREVVSFIETHAQRAHLIWGSAALAFGLRFDPRLLDDAYLGIRSHKTADVIIVGPLYKIVFDVYRNERPEDWRMISTQLARYQIVFENPDYKVYFLPATMECRLGERPQKGHL